jgi:hypothetical protein
VVVVRREGGGGGGSVGGMTLSALLATAYLDGGEVCRQTDTGKLGLIRFYAPLDIGLVVLTSSSPSRGRNSFGEKRCFWKPK